MSVSEWFLNRAGQQVALQFHKHNRSIERYTAIY